MPDAATALQCAHSGWGSRKLDIVQELVRRGIRFNTAASVAGNPRRISLGRWPCHGLGPRRAGYNPDLLDYESYVLTRDTYLRQPHCRAALLAGGIVWRLAFEALGISPVLDGPTAHTLKYGMRISASDASGQAHTLYDDSLMEDETNLICEVYKIYTGTGCSLFSLS